MTKKKKIRLVRILIFATLFLTGVVSLSYYRFKKKGEKPPDLLGTFQEKIKDTQAGKVVLNILGLETEKQAEEEKKKEEDQEQEEEKQSLVKNLKEKIEGAVIETSSEKVIEMLKTLPPEEFEKLKKEFCPQFCEGD